jgi:SAM-dependent methyltransferase
MFPAEVLRVVPYPWFSTNWTWNPGERVTTITTEDFYFYAKARKYGFRLFADTSIQCLHEDRNNGGCYGLTNDMPQAGGIKELNELADKGELLAADLGAGLWSPQWPDNIKIVKFDIRKDSKPDVQCDIAHIPEVYFGRFDIVHVCHVLEHFPRRDAPELLNHWLKLLKPGGKIIIKVPNVKHALDIINNAVANPGTIDGETQGYAWSQLYGDQRGYEDSSHKNGFIKEKLLGLFKSNQLLDNIEVEETEGIQNLKATAILRKANLPESLVQDYFSDFMVDKPVQEEVSFEVDERLVQQPLFDFVKGS